MLCACAYAHSQNNYVATVCFSCYCCFYLWIWTGKKIIRTLSSYNTNLNYCDIRHLCDLWPLTRSCIQYLMFRLMWAGFELLFLVPVRAEGGEGLWLAGLERGLDTGWEGGGWAGVSPDGEVDGGGVHCHTAGSPPWASFSELKGALLDWSVSRKQDVMVSSKQEVVNESGATHWTWWILII